MKPLLFITDEGGAVLYKNAGISLQNAQRLWIETATGHARGLVSAFGRHILIREFMLRGCRYLLFWDFDRLHDQFGEEADRAAGQILDPAELFKQARRQCSLGGLLRFFKETVCEPLEKEGVVVKVKVPHADAVVQTAPSAFALALTLLLRLAATRGSELVVSFVIDHGRVIVFVDSLGGKPLFLPDRALLVLWLQEVAGTAGFVFEENDTWVSLTLTPLDISLLGFKSLSFDRFRRNFAILVDLF